MRGIRFWLIGIFSFISVNVGTIFVPGSLLNRSIAIFICAIFSASSTVCINNFSGRVIAAQLDTPSFTSSAKQLDADHAEIRLIFPKGCEFISHLTKTPEGIIQDTLQYSHNDIKACGVKPFNVYYSNAGQTIEVKIQGEHEHLRLDASITEGTIQQTYQDDYVGKAQQKTTPIPKTILDYLNTSRKKHFSKGSSSSLIQQPQFIASNKLNLKSLDRLDSSAIAFDLTDSCDLAKGGQFICDSMSMLGGIGGFGSLIGFTINFNPYLRLASLFSGTVCAVLYGGFPPIFGFRVEGLTRKLEKETESLTRNLDAWGELKNTPIFKAYADDLNRINEELARAENGNAVIGIATGMDAYFNQSKRFSILSNIVHGQLDNFLNDCEKKEEQKKQKQGGSTGDPHLATFDGLRYDLQALGEFILTKSNNGTFELQARHTPFSSSISVNSAVAMKLGRNKVALYAKELPDGDTSTPLRVNGKPTIIQGNKLTLPGGGEILQQGNNYVINSPTGEKVLVSFAGGGNTGFLNISPFVYNRSERYTGLLGNVNSNPNDDLQTRGGTNVLAVRSTYGDLNKVFNFVGLRAPGALDKAEQVYFDQLYKEFGNSWRVKQEESLFDYPPGKTTENYVDPSFPSRYLTLNMLSTDQIQKARNACTKAKVSQDLMEGCVFDVGFSGFSEFARTAAEVSDYIHIINQLVPGANLPTPQQAINREIQRHKPKVCFFGTCL